MSAFFRFAAENALAQAEATNRSGRSPNAESITHLTRAVSASPQEIGETPGRPVTNLHDHRRKKETA